MIANKYELTMQEKGQKAVTKSADIPPDQFRDLVTNPEGVLSRVGASVGESTEYGGLKVSVTVTLTCDQTQEKIDLAGERAFFKAKTLMEDGWAQFRAEGKIT